MKRIALTLAGLALAAAAHAQVAVKDAWVRATVAQQKATGAFMVITSTGDARLVGARTPVAGVAEVHEMAMAHGVMRMRAVEGGLALPAGKAVALQPGGYHVMLMDLKQQVKAGDTVPLTLIVEDHDGKRQQVELQVPVRPLNAAASGATGHGGMSR